MMRRLRSGGAAKGFHGGVGAAFGNFCLQVSPNVLQVGCCEEQWGVEDFGYS